MKNILFKSFILQVTLQNYNIYHFGVEQYQNQQMNQNGIK